ncbi:hypothetical protein FZW96_07405 [Bacillus sp. BGMRC 2118]|nr:hypothetical protein FZW96_07405 [Bacillus sp. BGMRC 2118]
MIQRILSSCIASIAAYLLMVITALFEEPETQDRVLDFIVFAFVAIIPAWIIFLFYTFLMIPLSAVIDWMVRKARVRHGLWSYVLKLVLYLTVIIVLSSALTQYLAKVEVFASIIVLLFFHTLYVFRKEWRTLPNQEGSLLVTYGSISIFGLTLLTYFITFWPQLFPSYERSIHDHWEITIPETNEEEILQSIQGNRKEGEAMHTLEYGNEGEIEKLKELPVNWVSADVIGKETFPPRIQKMIPTFNPNSTYAYVMKDGHDYLILELTGKRVTVYESYVKGQEDE